MDGGEGPPGPNALEDFGPKPEAEAAERNSGDGHRGPKTAEGMEGTPARPGRVRDHGAPDPLPPGSVATPVVAVPLQRPQRGQQSAQLPVAEAVRRHDVLPEQPLVPP